MTTRSDGSYVSRYHEEVHFVFAVNLFMHALFWDGYHRFQTTNNPQQAPATHHTHLDDSRTTMQEATSLEVDSYLEMID